MTAEVIVEYIANMDLKKTDEDVLFVNVILNPKRHCLALNLNARQMKFALRMKSDASHNLVIKIPDVQVIVRRPVIKLD